MPSDVIRHIHTGKICDGLKSLEHTIIFKKSGSKRSAAS